MACRPKTLPAAAAPVVIGAAMAYGDGVFHFLSASLCLWCALLIQIGTNLANDYFDFKKGADTAERIGPTRVTQAGLLSPQAVKRSFIFVFAAAILASAYLVHRGGVPIVVIGILSIASGILYTAGPKPLGYIGLGEFFVFTFFGPVAVAGTYYAQSLAWSNAAFLAGLGAGALSVSMLCVNNYRDMHTDALTGKRTLAVRFGQSFARGEYIASILFAAVIPLCLYLITKEHFKIVFASLTALIAIPNIQVILTKTDGPALNRVLGFTGKLLIIYSVLFSLGWIL